MGNKRARGRLNATVLVLSNYNELKYPKKLSHWIKTEPKHMAV